MGAFIDLSGQTFGRLKVIERGINHGAEAGWVCRCECGRKVDVRSTCLRVGKTKSCSRKGCKVGKATHRLSASREFFVWAAMIQRCYNPKCKLFKNYGARGIKVCKRWLDSFENFFADMGFRPSSKHSIERIDNDGDYKTSNCKWATKLEQCRNFRRNRLVTAMGKTQCVTDWSYETGVSLGKIVHRLNHGWTPEQALGFETKERIRRWRRRPA